MSNQGHRVRLPRGSVRNATTMPATTKFQDLVSQKKLSPKLGANIPFEAMTDVQAATIHTAISGKDIFARAKTGTGKTFAFLIPSIQRLLQKNARGDKISILVISPTRELARQIEKEANTLVSNTGLGVQCVVGGENMNREQRTLHSKPCHILVATPGRFLDHVKNSKLREKLDDVSTLILDEADRLLDGGFRPALLAILDSLPKRDAKPRQTLLFSATVSEQVKSIASIALLPQHDFISTVSESDQSTHAHVTQEYALAPEGDVYPLLYASLTAHHSATSGNAKSIVFCTTANIARIVYEMLAATKPPPATPVLQIHSRLSQAQRDRAAQAFRTAPSAVLVASDVVARGLDFDGVSYVVQVGFPADADQYVHRLGRTARAGKAGAGLLIMAPHEAPFLSLPSMRAQPLSVLSPTSPVVSPASIGTARNAIANALVGVSNETKARAYQAWLGYHMSHLRMMRWTAVDAVRAANAYAARELRYVGEGEGAGLPPPIQKMVIGKMKLKGVPGLNIVSEKVGSVQGRGRGPSNTTGNVKATRGAEARRPL